MNSIRTLSAILSILAALQIPTTLIAQTTPVVSSGLTFLTPEGRELMGSLTPDMALGFSPEIGARIQLSRLFDLKPAVQYEYYPMPSMIDGEPHASESLLLFGGGFDLLVHPSNRAYLIAGVQYTAYNYFRAKETLGWADDVGTVPRDRKRNGHFFSERLGLGIVASPRYALELMYSIDQYSGRFSLRMVRSFTAGT